MATVKLIAHTPQPEKVVAAAAKLCYSAADVDTLMDKLDSEAAGKFTDMLAEIGHESPTEHASFTFAIEGVSRSLLAQITRHRIASFSVQSQRYVKELSFAYVVPPEIEAIPEAKEIFLASMEEAQKRYTQLSAILKEKHMDTLLKQRGLTVDTAAPKMLRGIQKQAEKMAIEDARFVLPNACDTKMIVTMNARSLKNFFAHRCCNRAQWEIRELATEMLRLVKEAAPNLFKYAGPKCVFGECPEGKMSCGRMGEVRAFFKTMAKENHGDSLSLGRIE